MICVRRANVLLVLMAGAALSLPGESAEAENRIELSLADDGQGLKMTYVLSGPASGLEFARTPDDSRQNRWSLANDDFEMVQADGRDRIRRVDGEEFSTVVVTVPATYVALPKDYAPFSPFSDGSLLIHSGRFQACPVVDPGHDGECSGPWAMEMRTPPGTHIILRGETFDRFAWWSDAGDGTKIYVGKARPRSGSTFIAIVDPGLPGEVSNLLSTSLPTLMERFSRLLPPLAARPMLFVSFDSAFEHGYGRQDGTLPNQIFMHYYGSEWDSGDAIDSSPEDTLWFLAHEAAHLFQHGVSGALDSSWIHEGSAEALAYLLLRDTELVSKEYLDGKRDRAVDRCVDALGNGSLASAAERGSFSEYYDCGLILFLSIDNRIRARSGGEQDVFGFWSTLIVETDSSEPWRASDFMKYTAAYVGDEFADQVNVFVNERQDRPEAALQRLAD